MHGFQNHLHQNTFLISFPTNLWGKLVLWSLSHAGVRKGLGLSVSYRRPVWRGTLMIRKSYNEVENDALCQGWVLGEDCSYPLCSLFRGATEPEQGPEQRAGSAEGKDGLEPVLEVECPRSSGLPRRCAFSCAGDQPFQHEHLPCCTYIRA